MKEELLQLKNFIDESIRKANRLDSKIKARKLIRSNGFGSERVRHLLNNLCSLDNTTFLDVGCYRGQSTGCASWENDVTTYCVDTFTFDATAAKPYNSDNKGSIIQAFNTNMKLYRCYNKVKLIEDDITNIDLSIIKHPINICHYDANTTPEKTYKAIDHILPVFSTYFIIVGTTLHHVDICNNIEKALKDNKIKIHHSVQIQSRMREDVGTWWNGVKIWLLEKEISEQELNKQKVDKKDILLEYLSRKKVEELDEKIHNNTV